MYRYHIIMHIIYKIIYIIWSQPHASVPPSPPAQMRVANMGSLVHALSTLPRGTSTAPEVPDLQPVYEGSKPPPNDATSFKIKAWQVSVQRSGLAISLGCLACAQPIAVASLSAFSAFVLLFAFRQMNAHAFASCSAFVCDLHQVAAPF